METLCKRLVLGHAGGQSSGDGKVTAGRRVAWLQQVLVRRRRLPPCRSCGNAG